MGTHDSTSGSIVMLHLTDAEVTAFGLLQSGGESDIRIERGAKLPHLLSRLDPTTPTILLPPCAAWSARAS